MHKYIKLYLTIAIFLVYSSVYSLESVRVMVSPFEIYGKEDGEYLKGVIQKVIKENLEKDGATIIDFSEKFRLPKDFDQQTINNLRAAGNKDGIDYIILGKQIWTGEKFSLNVSMLAISDTKPLDTFIVNGDGIESLPAMVKQLSDKIIKKIFKPVIVAKVIISGNKRIEADAIKKVISTSPGVIYSLKTFTNDIKALYAMGYFDDIRVETEEGPEGKTVIFKVKEKPSIKSITFKGLSVFNEEEINKNLTIKDGSIINIFEIRRNIARIEELYKEKQYHNADIIYNIHQLGGGQANLEFVIREGKKLRIKQITLLGNDIYSDKELKKIMKTKKKGVFSFITSSGVLNKDNLYQDAAMLYAFYHNNGYIHAKIGEPEIEYKNEWIYIIIRINEGEQFKVGKVDLEGESIIPKEKLHKALRITKETFYNREVIHNDILALADLYSNMGYAYADISPRITTNASEKTVNIVFVISKGEKVYFEKIIITGNSKTRDKVIRRELPVFEQGLYSKTGLKRAERNLVRLDYFEDLKINTLKGSSDDKMILEIDVKEKPTGTLSFGGGYSSEEKVFALASINQRNLFGRGQSLSLKTELGSKTTSYILDFREPWIFDTRFSGGINVYKWEKDYDDYDADSKGGGLYAGYPVFDYTRLSCNYSIDVGEVRTFYLDTPDSIIELYGQDIISSNITIGLHYDSRNKAFNATRGAEHSISVQYAGLGGDVSYTKLRMETGWYFPLIWKFIGFVHGKTGLIWDNSSGVLPDYDLFRLGGINSLRGFEWDDLAPKETNTFGYETEIGGHKFVQANIECLVPFGEKSGIMGLVFFDTGDLYDEGESIKLNDLRESVGFGIRWNSPMGPLRLEYGYILDPEEDAGDGGRFEFSMGAAF